MSLKLLIDSKHSKVVFAEAGKDFVDFLLNLLALPLGTVIQLLTKPAMTGCVANLYGSLEKLDESYLQPNQNKDSLLKPTVAAQSMQLRGLRQSSYHLSQEVKFVVTSDSTSTNTPPSDQGGYVKGLVTYTVTDDLSVSPMSMVSVVGLLNKFNIKDFGVLKEKVVEFGIDEGIELLKASLFSKDALTAVFLLKGQRWRASSKLENKIKKGADHTLSSISK
ncbi:hypothetical protein OIU85_023580 [Salix viminalis]|uniref:DUF674 domain-containing protein n=1 Tax=Salix viminalis TaxID=40686 RepID=A0A9Q0TYY6_SALVM|nr:hypothetical protein OIU85_023580 [Salix viminalis]